MDEISFNISKLNKHRDAVVVRIYPKSAEDFETKLLSILNKSQVKIISHFNNNIHGDITHFGSCFSGKSSIKKMSAKHKSMSFHGRKDLHRDLQNLQRLKPQMIFLSPIFHTKTHPNAKPLGKIATFQLAFEIKKQSPYSKIFLLGGINQQKFKRIKKLDFHNMIEGFAFIRG